jgi:cobalt/nickel transport system permease protein
VHIAEGYLPARYCIGWAAAAAPFTAVSIRRVSALTRQNPEQKLLLAASGAFLFSLTALKLPSVTGSSSHPAGTALAVCLLGPGTVPALSLIVLIFQALLLAHGGLTTLGANVFSLGVAGPSILWLVYRGLLKAGVPQELSCGLAAVAGDLTTYLTTSLQLSLAFPDPASGVFGSFLKFAGIFFVTQIPIAIAEAVLTVLVLNNLKPYLGEHQLVQPEG